MAAPAVSDESCFSVIRYPDPPVQDLRVWCMLQFFQQLIIVDVEDPSKTRLTHKLWNKYYNLLLKDQGHDFWNFASFQELVSSVCPQATYKKVITNRGSYMLALCPTSPK